MGEVVVVTDTQRDEDEYEERQDGDPRARGELLDCGCDEHDAESRAPVALKKRLRRQCGSRRRNQRTTIPA